ncbi:unnamed protein product [Durusdinium trenchii]|uniref:Translational activator GCN1 n=3 Tax=Durusdinium trenchii TaxID=1381693 RepID=A0ABP0R009_9DINO
MLRPWTARRRWARSLQTMRPKKLPRWVGPQLLVTDRDWRGYQAEVEAENPALLQLRLAMRQSYLVQGVYRRALRTMLLGLLDKDILAQAARQEDAGQVVPFEDLVCLIPASLLSEGLISELEGMAQDVHIAQQKAETKQRALAIEDEEGDEEKQPKRRVLCRSTHDKTKQEQHKQYEKPW